MPLEEGVKDLQVQVHYPGNKDGELLTNDRFPLMRPEVLQAIGDAKGIPASALRSLFGGSMQEDPSCEVSTASKWPIAVFTSGIWGSCEMYTQFLRDLASYGMVVIAIEHEDGSGIYAVNSEGEKLPYVDPPKDADVRSFRQPNLEKRTKEITATVNGIKSLASNSSKTSPLARVLQQCDCDQLALIGHSLGAAGAWRYLRMVPSCPFRFVLLMDLWPAVLLEEDFSFSPTVDYAIVLSEEWMKNPRFLRGNGRLAASGKCLAALQSPGTSHQWISETQMIMPSFVLRRMGLMGPGDWSRCYSATVQASAELVRCGLGQRSKITAMQAIEKLDPDVFKAIQFAERNDLPFAGEESLNRLAGQ